MGYSSGAGAVPRGRILMRRRQLIEGAVTSAVLAALPGKLALGALDPAAKALSAVTLAGDDIQLGRASVEALAGSLQGTLLTPASPAYDKARQLWSASFDHYPSLIAQCASAEDVRTAVQFAREHKLLTSVKCGGHSFSGKSAADRGMMIDLGAMRAALVDTAGEVVRVGGGARLGTVDRATLEHKLVTVLGTDSDTGAGGLTLGGGLGRLNRVWGMTIDNLVAAELVTADGRILELSARENPDLFWAIRGGGGNFGVVTRFDYRVHPFNPMIYGGDMSWPWEQRLEIMRAIADMTRDGPDALFISPYGVVDAKGEPHFSLEALYVGDHAEGEKALAELARIGKPSRVDLRVLSYMDRQATPPGTRRRSHYMKNAYVKKLTDEVAAAALEAIPLVPGFITFFHPMGGAVSRVGPQDTAFPHRAAGWAIGISIAFDDNSLFPRYRAAVREHHARVEPYSIGFYNNLMNTGNEGKLSENYAVNLRRLAQIKRRYDPDNFFRLNANILPAGEAA